MPNKAENNTELIETLGPSIVLLLQTITAGLKVQTAVIETGQSVVGGALPAISPILALLLKIAGNTEKDPTDLDDSDILNQIGQFFDPVQQKNKMRQQRVFPNP